MSAQTPHTPDNIFQNIRYRNTQDRTQAFQLSETVGPQQYITEVAEQVTGLPTAERLSDRGFPSINVAGKGAVHEKAGSRPPSYRTMSKWYGREDVPRARESTTLDVLKEGQSTGLANQLGTLP